MKDLSKSVIDYVGCEGACAAGIATVETLAGGPPSAELTYVLKNAKSAISFAVALDQSLIPPFLMKKERLSHERDNFRAHSLASGISLHLSKFLEQKGYPSVPVASNDVYRYDTQHGSRDMFPDISLRYLAVRSGVGHFGFSGNVITKSYGAAVILGATVTTAELVPTNPLPKEETYCDACGLCRASCVSGFMDPQEKTCILLGGKKFTYSRRRNYLRCEFVCAGFTGLHSSGKWSTWSPGRFTIPESDEDLVPAVVRGLKASSKWPETEGGRYQVLMEKKLFLTCGNCQLVCYPDKEERKRRHKMLIESGVILQRPDGSLEAISPDMASKRISSMTREIRMMYEDIDR